MSRYPGAYWRPSGSNQGSMSRIRALSLHIAVNRALVPANGYSDIWGWVNSENSCHLYDDRYGALEQYKEFGEIAYGVLNGNSEVLTYESWDGLLIQNNPYREIPLEGFGDAQSGTWTAEQCERKADVIAWLHLNEGLPIQNMGTSWDSGVGPHRLGVPEAGLYSDGDQLWTSHAGKACPGNARVAQIPGIVARAQVIADAVTAGKCTWLPVGPVDITTALARTAGTSPTTPTNTPEDDELSAKDVQDLKTYLDSKFSALDRESDADRNELIKRMQAVGLEVRNGRVDIKNWVTKNRAQIITAIQRAQAAGGSPDQIADAVADALGN